MKATSFFQILIIGLISSIALLSSPDVEAQADCPTCRPVTCRDQWGNTVADELCNPATRPSSTGTVQAGAAPRCPAVVNHGVCGPLNGATTPTTTPTSAQLCQNGLLVPLTMGGSARSRQCAGSGGGDTVSCNTVEPQLTCDPPYISNYHLTITQDTSFTGANGIFNIWFDQNLYENVKVQTTSPVNTLGAATNYTPASNGYFGSTTRSIRIVANCKSNGQQVISNTIQATGTNSTATTTPTCNKVWIDNTPFNRGGIGYGYFTEDKTVVNPTTNLQDACQGYVVNNDVWYKYECVSKGIPNDPGGYNWYKYLINGGGGNNTTIWTDQYGTPTNPPTTNAGGYTNTPTYNTIGSPQNRLSSSTMYTRLVPIAQACN